MACSGLQRTGIGFLVGCKIHGRLVLCLSWTIECMEDQYWIFTRLRVYGGLVLGLSGLLKIRYWINAGLQSIGRTCIVSEVDCILHGGLILGLQWTIQNTEDWYWVCSGLQRIRRTDTVSPVDYRVYRRLELGLQWTVEYTEDWNLVYKGLKNIRRTSTVKDCRVIGGLELRLQWTVEYTED